LEWRALQATFAATPLQARHLHAVRFGIFRRWDVSARADRESVWTEGV